MGMDRVSDAVCYSADPLGARGPGGQGKIALLEGASGCDGGVGPNGQAQVGDHPKPVVGLKTGKYLLGRDPGSQPSGCPAVERSPVLHARFLHLLQIWRWAPGQHLSAGLERADDRNCELRSFFKTRMAIGTVAHSPETEAQDSVQLRGQLCQGAIASGGATWPVRDDGVGAPYRLRRPTRPTLCLSTVVTMSD
jgi:hypothetical protein